MENSKTGLKKFIYDFKRYLPLLFNLASKDIKVKYRRSVLGIAWSILNPLLTMLVLTQVFQMLLRVQVENFATYYIVGSSLWAFFSESTSLSLSSILGASSLIKKVYIPKYKRIHISRVLELQLHYLLPHKWTLVVNCP